MVTDFERRFLMSIVNTRYIALVFVLSWVVLGAGCVNQPKPLYSWGDYQTIIYKMYVKPGEATPAEQVGELTQDIEKAQASDMRVAPGVHAQLGYMAYLDGRPGMAAEQFEAERVLYPESTHFVDRLLATMRGAQQ